MSAQPGDRAELMNPFEVVAFAKADGALTKSITLNAEGRLSADGSACKMATGSARRVRLERLQDLSYLIAELKSNEAIALGALRPDLPDSVQIVPKAKLEGLNGSAVPGVIARTSSFIAYQPTLKAFALLDYDRKGMPAEVAARIEKLGGFWKALVSVLPELAAVGRVERASTSAGLVRTDTGKALATSGGLHVFIAVQDGTDIPRFLRTLHERCWIAGFAWMMVGSGGQLLERSIVDRSVGSAERLVFEGAPILGPLLRQDAGSRRPIVVEGPTLDTAHACPRLTILENSNLRNAMAREEHRLAGAAARERESFVADRAARLAERTGMPKERATRIIERQCRGILLPHIVLSFDDPEFAETTVAAVLADPARYDGMTLADPLEGPEYGSCKAKIMRYTNGEPWIHSFAHGRTTYELRYDAEALSADLDKASSEEAADMFIRRV